MSEAMIHNIEVTNCEDNLVDMTVKMTIKTETELEAIVWFVAALDNAS